jgi:hypothetical protein
MGKAAFNLTQRVLCILRGNHNRIFSIDDLLLELGMVSDPGYSCSEHIGTNRENECVVLDALIFLNDNGFVVLNSNDTAFITAKGIIMSGDNFFN